MLKLEVRSPQSRQFHGDKFAEVMRIDYENNKLIFVAGYNGKKPMLYIQKGFLDTEFRLHESKSHKERN